MDNTCGCHPSTCHRFSLSVSRPVYKLFSSTMQIMNNIELIEFKHITHIPAIFLQNYCSIILRWPFVPGFSRTVLIFNDLSWKNHSSPGMPIFGLVSWFAHLYSCRLTHRWPKISSDFICIYEKIAGVLLWTLLEELMMLSQAPKSDLQQLAPVALAPYDSYAFGACPRLRCPNCGHLT